MVEQIFAELARIEVLLVADGDRLRFHPREKVSPELIEQLKSHKAEILAIMGDPWPQDYVEPAPARIAVAWSFGKLRQVTGDVRNAIHLPRQRKP